MSVSNCQADARVLVTAKKAAEKKKQQEDEEEDDVTVGERAGCSSLQAENTSISAR